ncbi:MAG: glycosyltransferase family 4 protein [Magnetococcales bacterium]|nr:glycosyltransferase family 4 protein [Magnetococcales bacterium]
MQAFFSRHEAREPDHVLVVFHASFPETRGGINVMIDALARQWVALGVRVSILVPAPWERGPGLTGERHGAITVYRMRLRSPWDSRRPLRGLLGWLAELPGTLWVLWRLLRRERVRVIHFHTPRDYQLLLQLLSVLGGPPVVMTFHGTDALEFARTDRNAPWLHRWIVTRAAAVTAVADHYARMIATAHPRCAPVTVIPNGVPWLETEERAPCPEPLPGRFWVMVGWIEPPKAQDVAIMAWGEVVRHSPDLHLVIVGEAPYLRPGQPYYPGFLDTLRALACQHQVETRIHYTGVLPRAQVLAVLERAEGLLFPSHREGMPYALLEAGAVGIPVVCNRIPPFTDLIVPERTGLLTPDSDPIALAGAVSRLERDPELGRAMGRAWREEVRERYSVEAMASGYLNLFRRVTGRPFASPQAWGSVGEGAA